MKNWPDMAPSQLMDGPVSLHFRLQNLFAYYPNIDMIVAPTLTSEGLNMSKSQDQKKDTKKKPAKSLKEKRAAKKEKKSK